MHFHKPCGHNNLPYSVNYNDDITTLYDILERMETELNNKCKERDMLAEKESVVRLSLQRLQNDLNDSEDRYRRLDNKVILRTHLTGQAL